MSAAREGTCTAGQGPLFQEFRWHGLEAEAGGETQALELAGSVRDIAGGARLVLGLLERDGLARDNGRQELLSRCHQGLLERFAISALTMLEESADHFIGQANRRAETARPQQDNPAESLVRLAAVPSASIGDAS